MGFLSERRTREKGVGLRLEKGWRFSTTASIPVKERAMECHVPSSCTAPAQEHLTAAKINKHFLLRRYLDVRTFDRNTVASLCTDE
jgi:hypothetical protein